MTAPARLLIVEDDEAIATGLALNLKLAGRTTSIARDGDLLDAAREDAQEIIATDPHLTGAAHVPLRDEMRRSYGRDWEWVRSG